MNSSFMESYQKNTVVFRNFENMAKLPPAESLKERRAEIVPGMENIWYEYLPESAKAKGKYPLVVQIHGGGNDGRRWADFTIWHKIADREGFMVIYPNSPDYETWKCGDRDIQFVYDLIEKICAEYPIDRERIYMQGMSNGDMMTLAFTMQHPEVLAAAGYMTGSSPEEMICDERPIGALPVLQMRGEKDVFFHLPDPLPENYYIYEKRYGMNDLNRFLWQDANKARSVPKMQIRGKNNLLYYEGEKAPVIVWEIKDMGHREPAEGAEMLWETLYRFCRRVDGKTVCSLEFAQDETAVAFSTGSLKILKAGKLIDYTSNKDGYPRVFKASAGEHFAAAPLDEMFETPALYAPAELLCAAFDAKLETFEAGDRIQLAFPSGETLELYSNSLLVLKNGRYVSLKKPCTLLCGQFLIPVGELMAQVFGKCVSEVEGVMLITDHFSELGRYTARMIREATGGIQTL
ncbi:MAG: hypothetical protein II713_00205 [Clostridia bacterium]|nr:hypothetical protein [Clostridia bacterium]